MALCFLVLTIATLTVATPLTTSAKPLHGITKLNGLLTILDKKTPALKRECRLQGALQ